VSTVAGRRAKRRATAAAKKQRRQMVIAFGGLAVLAILLLIQGPKLLAAFGGSETPAASPASEALPVPEPERKPRSSLLTRAPRLDPFAARRLPNGDPQMAAVSAPAGARDPFQQKSVPAPAPAPTPAAPAPLPQRIVVGTPSSPNAVAEHGWIVVLASVRTGAGRAYAQRVARVAEGRGLDASVLDSSTRRPLRAGYYVVYTGPYSTLSAVQGAAGRVRASGYRTAYVREILRYGAR
jgi:hypothetical protein